MSIIVPAVISAAELVSSVVSTAKTTRDLAKDSVDHKLKESISELYDGLISIKEHVIDLESENRRLKEELARKDEIEGPAEPFGYFFTKQKPNNPLCPKCLQSELSKVVFLSPLRKHKGGELRRCPVCQYGNYEEPPKSGPAIAMVPSITSRARSYWD
jgi:hypothetical protein